QDGNPREIDLLQPRHCEQQIEGALEAVERDDEHLLLARRIIGPRHLPGLDAFAQFTALFGYHSALSVGGLVSRRVEKLLKSTLIQPRLHTTAVNAQPRAASASAESNGSFCDSAARQRSNRRSGCPVSVGTPAAACSISSSRPLQWRTTSLPARMTASARAHMLPDRACMDRSSLMSRPSNPISPRSTSRGVVTIGSSR